MTPEQKQLVRNSWSRIAPIQVMAAESFYRHLFETNPEFRPYFKSDIEEQGRKLMAMLNSAVKGLDKLDAMTRPLRELGYTHRVLGVTPGDYDKVRDALLWTLEKGLGDAFTPEVRAAWISAYTSIAKVMIDGAEYRGRAPTHRN